MEELTKEEKAFLIMLTKRKPEKRGKYVYYNLGNKHFKRSRVLIQLHLNKRLRI
ncbi:MAG TPA: hypothetical protein VJ438_06050 [Candidatus Nanoarchaeia archaeon]|nr:hypothetical protein [Candidatus Nanoarchaeia archaeon]